MIQRIQTVYLFLVFLFALIFLFLPLGTIDIGGVLFDIKSWRIVSANGSEILEHAGFFRIIVVSVPFLVMILSLITTFQYKQRLLQIRLGKLNLLLHVLLVVVTFFYLDSIRIAFNANLTYAAGIIFPLISMILVVLANRAIRRDENLVRAADRLR
jgi:hypothetical protein